MSSIAPQHCTDCAGREFVIRNPLADDAPALLDYITRVAAETEFFIIEPDEFPNEEAERQRLQDYLDHPGKMFLIAEAAGAIIGSLTFDNGRYRRTAHQGELGICVHPQWRGQGVGTLLLQSLLDWAAASPVIEKINLGVFVTNERAIRLYKKLGFVEVGITPREVQFGPDRYVDVLRMYRFVKPI